MQMICCFVRDSTAPREREREREKEGTDAVQRFFFSFASNNAPAVGCRISMKKRKKKKKREDKKKKKKKKKKARNDGWARNPLGIAE